MEPENTNQPVVEANLQNNSLHQVTPLSKYLALALFVILPFLGGYVGYTFAPEKVVEVEKEVIKEMFVDSSVDDIDETEPVFQMVQSKPRYSEFDEALVSVTTVMLVSDSVQVQLMKIFKGSCNIEETGVIDEIITRIPGMEAILSPDHQLLSTLDCFGLGQYFYEFYLVKTDGEILVIGVLDDPTGGPGSGNPYSEPEILYSSQI